MRRSAGVAVSFRGAGISISTDVTQHICLTGSSEPEWASRTYPHIVSEGMALHWRCGAVTDNQGVLTMPCGQHCAKLQLTGAKPARSRTASMMKKRSRPENAHSRRQNYNDTILSL